MATWRSSGSLRTTKGIGLGERGFKVLIERGFRVSVNKGFGVLVERGFKVSGKKGSRFLGITEIAKRVMKEKGRV